MAEISRNELVKIIRKMVNKGESGSVLISDQNNHSGIIAIKKGEIIAISYGVKRGMVSLPYLQSIQRCTYRINGMVLGRHTANMMPTDKLLDCLTETETETNQISISSSNIIDATQQLFTKYAGPAASIIIEEVVSEVGIISNLTKYRIFTIKLSKEIIDANEAKQFIEACSKLETTLNLTENNVPTKKLSVPPHSKKNRDKTVGSKKELVPLSKALQLVNQMMIKINGPVALIIIEDILDECGSITTQDKYIIFIKRCAKEIPDASEAFQFIEKCTNLAIDFKI